MRGADPHAVQRLAGHQSIKTTLDTYGHLVPDYLRDQVERLRFEEPRGTEKPPEVRSRVSTMSQEAGKVVDLGGPERRKAQ